MWFEGERASETHVFFGWREPLYTQGSEDKEECGDSGDERKQKGKV
jgi:hypothetical protein